MAHLNSGVLGLVSGKVGELVVSNRNGVPYVKAASGPRTKSVSKKELANRKKFKVAQYFLRPLLHLVRIGFANYSERSYGFIAAKSHLLKNAMEGDLDNPVINPTKVKLSHGSLPLPENIVVSKIEPNTIEFSWDVKPGFGNSYDQAMMVAYDLEKRNCISTPPGQLRSTGKSRLTVDQEHTYHLYLAFVSVDRKSQSDSVYLGEMSF